MINFNVIIHLFWSIVWIASCIHPNRKNETRNNLHRTGEFIVTDDLIQKYEEEHQRFYCNEVKDGDHLEWSALDNKDLSIYCRKYLQQTIPSRTTDDATGMKIVKTLHYEKGTTSTTNKVVVVQCKVINKQCHLLYYMTSAPKPNCVYTLKSARNHNHCILTIINKQCNFEDKPLIGKSLKRKMSERVGKIHFHTGQPIAKCDFLLEYELEHQELLKTKGHNGNCILWPYATGHPNLDVYCYQYMKKCIPNRNREGITGSWKIQKLLYQKVNTTDVTRVITVTCLSKGLSGLRYYVTRAVESNCGYALIRQGNSRALLSIIYKHCDFETLNDQQNFSKNSTVYVKDLIPKNEVKKEPMNILEALQVLTEH